MSDYDVGYGKPPAEHRFKPGQSGNRKGRPKKAQPKVGESDAEILKRIDGELMDVSGTTMTKREVELRVIRAKAMKGDVRAFQTIEKMRAAAGVGKEQPRGGVLLVPSAVPLHEWEASTAIQQEQYRTRDPDALAKLYEDPGTEPEPKH